MGKGHLIRPLVLEALSLWEGYDGILRATMLSDDNFFMFQKTQFVELILTR